MNQLDSWNFFTIEWVEVGGSILGMKIVLAIAVVGLIIFVFSRKELE